MKDYLRRRIIRGLKQMNVNTIEEVENYVLGSLKNKLTIKLVDTTIDDMLRDETLVTAYGYTLLVNTLKVGA